MTGFYIVTISVQGKNVPPAEISFRRGCNVVTGASDTGKSYIHSLISYIFGKSEEPKKIVQSTGYEFVLTQIATLNEDYTYTLLRTFGDDKIVVKECKLREFRTSDARSNSYKTKGDLHSPQHISYFLMALCGLQNLKVLKNKTTGKTENLGFSSLRKLLWVDEVTIFKLESPFYFSGGNSNYTRDQSVLNVLLSNQDFSEVQQKEDRVIKETRLLSKIDFIIKQINTFAEDRARALPNSSAVSVDSDKELEMLTRRLEEDLNLLSQVTERSKVLQEEKLNLNKELLYNQEIERRFDLLTRQYQSDAQRLDFILEADMLTSQLGESVCPICSSPIGNDLAVHLGEVKEFRRSANMELEKIIAKQADLESTITTVRVTISNLTVDLIDLDKDFIRLQKVVKETSPRIRETRSILSDILAQRDSQNKIRFIDEEILKLYKELDRLQKLIKNKIPEENISVIEYPLLSSLSEFIQDRLARWNYEKKISIVFNSHYKVFDIVISGKERKSYGKGKRAISYTACTLGLLDYCANKGIPFPNLIVLDSPLTTFEEKRATESSDLGQAVQASFFQDLTTTSVDCQIIIFDNKEPSLDIQENLNTQIFTGLPGVGRSGFFPG